MHLSLVSPVWRGSSAASSGARLSAVCPNLRLGWAASHSNSQAATRVPAAQLGTELVSPTFTLSYS